MAEISGITVRTQTTILNIEDGRSGGDSRPISGASMNPAGSLAPAYIWGCYKDLWLYIVSLVTGALAGAWTHFQP
ncbi:hypothetical protein Bca4012_056392 [Brassica carinata]